MDWILNNRWDAFMLLWSIILRPALIVNAGILICFFVVARYKELERKSIIWSSIILMTIASVAVMGIRLYGYLNPQLDTTTGQENYSMHFNDVQRRQIVAAERYGIAPLKDRNEAKRFVDDNKLTHIKSNKNYQLAPMGHSIPYLTPNAASLLNMIGENFRDSLDAKGMTTHKIVVTSLLRTDADIEKLMRQNSVAVKNSAHRHATTFDISYTRFLPVSITTNANPHEMKKVLAEVLRDLRDAKLCYVKYEKSQNCFHITSRK